MMNAEVVNVFFLFVYDIHVAEVSVSPRCVANENILGHNIQNTYRNIQCTVFDS